MKQTVCTTVRHPARTNAPSHRRGAENRPTDEPTEDSHKAVSPSEYQLEHSRVVLEPGPAGTVARVERKERTEYAGPLDSETIRALAEVAE